MRGVNVLSQRLTAWDVRRQPAGLQVRVAVLNGFTTPGRPVSDVAGQVCPGQVKFARQAICTAEPFSFCRNV